MSENTIYRGFRENLPLQWWLNIILMTGTEGDITMEAENLFSLLYNMHSLIDKHG